MAQVTGINVTKYDKGAQGDNSIDQGLVRSTQEINTDKYVMAGLPANDTVVMAVLPNGAKVWQVVMYHDALGASTGLKVGDSTDDQRYINSSASIAGGVRTQSNRPPVGYVIGTNEGDDRILVTLTGGAGTGEVKLVITYTL